MILRLEHDIEQAAFAKAGLHCEAGTTTATFHVLDDQGLPSERWTASVSIDGGKLVFCPARSASHRQILARLGILTEGPAKS